VFAPNGVNYATGGAGAYVNGTLDVIPGEVLSIAFEGGGAGSAIPSISSCEGTADPFSLPNTGGGGAYSAIFRGSEPLVIAAGGGGSPGGLPGSHNEYNWVLLNAIANNGTYTGGNGPSSCMTAAGGIPPGAERFVAAVSVPGGGYSRFPCNNVGGGFVYGSGVGCIQCGGITSSCRMVCSDFGSGLQYQGGAGGGGGGYFGGAGGYNQGGSGGGNSYIKKLINPGGQSVTAPNSFNWTLAPGSFSPFFFGPTSWFLNPPPASNPPPPSGFGDGFGNGFNGLIVIQATNLPSPSASPSPASPSPTTTVPSISSPSITPLPSLSPVPSPSVPSLCNFYADPASTGVGYDVGTGSVLVSIVGSTVASCDAACCINSSCRAYFFGVDFGVDSLCVLYSSSGKLCLGISPFLLWFT
jgi:hypothetical protein